MTDQKQLEMIYRLKNTLSSSLGTNGLLLRDNEVEFLIDLIDLFLESGMTLEEIEDV